ncbi:TetR/AcrR family transcriptional regulator [Nocardioides lacusdianchii]|uniref:TetR/AcrR family transcriptional regulator n=1 Tax=Nocardioides lacusdianchii TaxID=2783664 RepID=UPI001CCEC5D5|nr:TetR/AcrR family transcriptional regulator [Nocardioides lacusdianchii]
MRDDMVASTLTLARTGASVSLESAARAAGVTKAGLMYHFSTKQALMTAVIDHLMNQYEHELTQRLTSDNSTAPTTTARLVAYLNWVCDGHFDHGDLVMFTDPRLREPLSARWNERMGEWVHIPETLPAKERARFHAVRLIADGIWLNSASNGISLTDEDRDAVQALAHQLLQENS